MKFKITFLLFIFSVLISNAQEIKLNHSVIGLTNNNIEGKNLNISNWKPGEVHSITLQQNEPDTESTDKGRISPYPNPFRDILHLNFQTDEQKNYSIIVTDISGRKQLFTEEKTISPNQVIDLDLTFLSSGMYLVTIIHEDKTTHHVFKVQKQ